MNDNLMNPSGLTKFLLHIHPQKVNKQTLIFSRTFGLGGINALLFLILALTGTLLRFSYVASPVGAYNSIVDLQNHSLFGSLLRNIHHWSAMLMVVASFLHLLRVFLSQSIYYERKRTWYYGLAMFILVLAFNFTGYLLPWDQLSFWAVTIMTNIISYFPFFGGALADIIRGGEMVNQNTLLNFYTFHTALLPLFFVFLMIMHFWLIRKAKGVTHTNQGEQKMVRVNPELISREIIAALILIALIIVFSMIFNAPLLEKANPTQSPNPSKAPWYFMGIQELLINVHPFFATFIIPFSLFAFLLCIPTVRIDKSKVGQWFYSKKGKKTIIFSILFSVFLTILLVIVLNKFIVLINLTLPTVISTGLIPFLMYCLPVLGFVLYLKQSLKIDKVELIISLMATFITSYLVMSIIGIWFRGESMNLIFWTKFI
jgi:quinol-cytochrome oxidoreductase complex cytochrome b subunit